MESTLDFFILNTISNEPLEILAEPTGKSSPGSSAAAFQRLERAGWVEIDWRQADSSPKKFYSLSPAGREQLEGERMNRSSAIARFVEDGGWENSFREFFLNNNN